MVPLAVNIVESLKLGVQQLNLDEFLKTPVEQRDYVKALEGTMLSMDGAVLDASKFALLISLRLKLAKPINISDAT